jgi:hypothetical protein
MMSLSGGLVLLAGLGGCALLAVVAAAVVWVIANERRPRKDD